MIRAFNNLTEIALLHGYYTDGTCADFTLAPTSDTNRFFRNYRLRFGAPYRGVRHQYLVLQEHVNGSPLIALPASYQLRFTMTLHNPDLLNFTDFSAPAKDEIFVFENQAVGTALHGGSFAKMTLAGEQFFWRGLTAGTTQITATHVASGDNFSVDVISEDENGSSVLTARFDFESLATGIYTLVGDGPGDTLDLYVDPELHGQDIFGIIHLTEGGGLSVGAAHDINFSVRSAAWKYFLVLKGSHTGFAYSVFENITSPTVTFSEVIIGGLTGTDGETRDLLSNLYSGATVKMFQSTTDIAYSEEARGKIALGRANLSNGGTVVPIIKNLPNPEPGAPNAAVVVGVDQPNP